MSRGDRCNALGWALVLTACRPTPTPVQTPTPPAFDPTTISDAAFTDQECAQFGSLRAADPDEPLSAEAYTAECVATTAQDPPWMRRTARCVLVAPSESDRKACFTEQLVRQREAADAHLEAQIEAERQRARREQLQEAERILREARAEEAEAASQPPADPQ